MLRKYFRLLSLVPTVCLSATAAAEPDNAAWEVSDLELNVRAKNTTSVYSMPEKKSVETLLMYTTDRKKPGLAFRCEKGRLYGILSVRPANLEKALRDGVRRPRDWTLTVTIGNGQPRSEAWVSMQNGKLVMAHESGTTKELFRAARDADSVSVVTRKGKKPVIIELPAGNEAMFSDYLDRCDLDEEYDPDV